jgi:hypothetical protein
VTLISDDLKTAIYFRLLLTPQNTVTSLAPAPAPQKRPEKGFVAYVGLGAGR